MNINVQQLEQSSTLLPGRETSLEGFTSGKKMEDSLQNTLTRFPDSIPNCSKIIRGFSVHAIFK